ncbi:hypothetical protein [Bacteroides cellulosilyticus]|jgi:hypothetical protein|uniref:hypothetical protein n=1 Tax=Bacteroides cellulosilyticus TaxID=246787 RepID=UPI0018A0D7DC|nr:hypothetical protein [Bacteroides cellulosilyticus]MBX9087309.1 hypothetical protein [Bacteroides cellulosilyticus]QUT89915.1 hypothetical protein INE78_01898 [Bacteroides cellulosilyticus]
MRLKKIGLLLLLIMTPLILMANSIGWKVIKNSLFCVTLPDDWVPIEGMPGDGTEPGRREARGFLIRYFAWNTPLKDKKDIPNHLGIEIDLYEKLDKSDVTLPYIEKKVALLNALSVEILASSNEAKSFIVFRNSKEMDGSTVRYRSYYLLKKRGLQILCAQISMRDNLIKSKPDVEEVVRKILNSIALGK